MKTMRDDPKEITLRLEAEKKACEIDPSLLRNDFVRGIINVLEVVDNERKKSYSNPEIDLKDFIAGMQDAIRFCTGENKY